MEVDVWANVDECLWEYMGIFVVPAVAVALAMRIGVQQAVAYAADNEERWEEVVDVVVAVAASSPAATLVAADLEAPV
ncbi:uncharacterized protein G6M90_00g086200 [Metarhizium brunneum]|uniref:Uncharacterized protein n=1 Tax=Metarhizium brunneum TaxID=500148 RepID=A0A7D5YUL4_9HYPO